MRTDNSEPISHDDDVFADAMAAFKEVSGRTPEVPAEAAPAPEAAPVDDHAAEPADTKIEAKSDDKGFVRRPDGKFAPKTEKTVDSKEAVDAATTKPAAAGDKPLDAKQDTQTAAPAGGPPPSWSIKSKAAWDRLPQEIRADIAKREGEVAQGLAALRDFKDLKPYADLAKQHNTTVAKQLDRYLGLENTLKQNVGQGLAIIAQNFGLNQDQAAQLFARLAQHYSGGRIQIAGGQPNGGGQPGQPADPMVEAMRPVLGPLMQEIEALKGKLSSREVADRNAQSQSLAKALEKFASDPGNRFFTDLEEPITRLFETGMVKLSGNPDVDLRTAYDMAARMNPEVHQALIEQRLEEDRAANRKREQEAADKARGASRSLTGSRVPGTRVVEREDSKSGSYDEDLEADVRKAFRSHRSA